MTVRGFNHSLYVLPFDHRGSFISKMFGWHEPLTPSQSAEISAAKRVIFDGLLWAVANGAPADKAAVLVDEEFGADILRDATLRGIKTACPVEKSGLEEFDFEYGADFARHIEEFHPTFCKVLVRYNPEGDTALNHRQVARLRQLSDYLHAQNRSLFMFELLVPAEANQFLRVQNDKHRYDVELRPRLMVQAITDLQNAGVEPDVWKIEGLDRPEDCRAIVRVARGNGRDNVGCIVLGRGEDDRKVTEWLQTASQIEGFIGFAVGRTDFWEPLTNLRAGKLTREDAVAEMGRRYLEFVHIFESARTR